MFSIVRRPCSRVERLPVQNLRSIFHQHLNFSEVSRFSTTPTPQSIIFGDSDVPFSSLNLDPSLVNALAANKMHNATKIQVAALPKLIDGKSLVIGAETGSGKTYAYMIPLLHQVLTSSWRKEEQSGEKDRYPAAVVLVPNRELMEQTLRMTERLLEHIPNSHSIAGLAVGADGVWSFPTFCPRILICTPNFLSSFVKGGRLLDAQLFRNLKTLVLDEADMLLDGSYLTHIERILEALKRTRREAIAEQRCKVHERLHQIVLSAATISSQGTRSVDRYIAHTFPHVERVTNTYLHKHHPLISQTYIHIPSSTSLLATSRINILLHFLLHPPADGSNISRISAEHLGDIVIPSTSASSAIDPPLSTMIFANTAEHVSQLAEALRHHNINCVEYHKLLHATKKQESLDRFRNGEVKLLLCTDAAARGIDIPDVKHIIQAEFAGNVVHHLHRIGRASRAGSSGKATIIYDDTSRELVEATISLADSGSVEQSFSRRRGFRKNIRRAAKYAAMEESERTSDEIQDENREGPTEVTRST